MQDNYYSDLGIYLYLVPIISAFWAAFALLTKRNKTKSQIFLAICFFVLGIGMGFSFWYDRYEAFSHSEVLRSVNISLSAFCVTSVLFYFTALMNPKRLTYKYALSYFSFIVLFSGILLILQSIYGKENSVIQWSSIYTDIFYPNVFIRVTAFLILIIFEIHVIVSCMRMYTQYKKYIKDRYSYETDIDLKWIKIILVFFVCFALADMIWMMSDSFLAKALTHIVAFIIICLIYYLGSRQDDIFIRNDNPIGDYESVFAFESGIENVKEEKLENLKNQIEDYFEKEKPYLNSSLNLNDIAIALNTNRTYLSQVINQEYGMNFYSFVNQYRIKYALSLINKNVTIDYVFEESGFKSKSVFYRQFKEVTGMTPLAYIKDVEKPA